MKKAFLRMLKRPNNYFAIVKSYGGNAKLVRRFFVILRYRGISAAFHSFIRFFKTTSLDQVSLRQNRIQELRIKHKDFDLAGPKISIILNTYKTPMTMLWQAIESVRNQSYQNYELVIVDDGSRDKRISNYLDSLAMLDNRIRVKILERNVGISNALNIATEMVTSEYFAVLDHDDELSEDALELVVLHLLDYKDTDYLYTDEDKLSAKGKEYFGPFFKPDWSPEYLLSMMYTCHLSVFRTSLVKELGGYRSKFDFAQDYDLVLRITEVSNRIVHIPFVCYHWRIWENSTASGNKAKPKAFLAAKSALKDHLNRLNESYKYSESRYEGHHQVVFEPRGNPLVSIVIPTANGLNFTGKDVEFHINGVLNSIKTFNTYCNIEIVVSHNGNLAQEQQKELRGLFSSNVIKFQHYSKAKFNLAEKINLGVEASNGEYVLILNDDIRFIQSGWLETLLGFAQRDGVGAVAPKLLFPNKTIQHAGVVLLRGLPGHPYYEWPVKSTGYALGLNVARNYLAVTGACMLTNRQVFLDLGGFQEKYALNYNDVDYCLRLHKRGLRSIYIPYVEAIHYEGVSKTGGRTVSSKEIELFLKDWLKDFLHDPYYNLNQNQYNPYTG
jgi:GT2 family glycosyltransferase